MTSKLALVAVLILGSFSAHAADPWDAVDAKVQKASLCEAYLDGGAYTFHRKSCSAFGCDEWDYTVRTSCQKSGSAPAATIEQSKNGTPFSRETLSESDWRGTHGNLLRSQAAFTQSFGNLFTLDSVQQTASGDLVANYTVRNSQRVLETGSWTFGDGASIPQVRERHVIKYAPFQEETTDTLVP